MEQKSGLKPGWQIFEAALDAILDPELVNVSPEELSRRILDFIQNILVRRDEIIPAQECDRLVDKTTRAITTLYYGCWPNEVYDFVVNHGGEEAIVRFLSAHPDWEQIPHPHNDNLLVIKMKGYQPVDQPPVVSPRLVDIVFPGQRSTPSRGGHSVN